MQERTFQGKGTEYAKIKGAWNISYDLETISGSINSQYKLIVSIYKLFLVGDELEGGGFKQKNQVITFMF